MSAKLNDMIDGDRLNELIDEAECEVAYWTEKLKFGSLAHERIDFWTGRLSGLESAKGLLR